MDYTIVLFIYHLWTVDNLSTVDETRTPLRLLLRGLSTTSTMGICGYSEDPFPPPLLYCGGSIQPQPLYSGGLIQCLLLTNYKKTFQECSLLASSTTWMVMCTV